MARAQEDPAPREIAPAPAATGARVHDYAAIFESCAKDGEARLASGA